MAATIKGRKGCPFCGFGSAHVKQTEGKHPYLHCPECGVMTHAKSGAQARLIVAGMRPEGQQPEAQQQPQAQPQAQAPKPEPKPVQPQAAQAAKPADTPTKQPDAKPAKAASWIDSLGI